MNENDCNFALQSIVAGSGETQILLAQTQKPEIVREDEVIIAMGAAPINPSGMSLLLGFGSPELP